MATEIQLTPHQPEAMVRPMKEPRPLESINKELTVLVPLWRDAKTEDDRHKWMDKIDAVLDERFNAMGSAASTSH